jgi:large subunit ribosomal protein L30
VAKKKQTAGAARYVKVTQIKSGVGRPETHRRTLRALGLRHQATVVLPENEAIKGMLFQVRHLVEVSEAEAPSAPAARNRPRKAATAGADKGEGK